MANIFEQRAQELMLNPDDKRAYLRLMQDSERGEYTITCPDCGVRFESYETETLKHVRTCLALRLAARPVAHIRVGVKRAGRRINDSRGNPGHTLCGAELTAYDVDLPYARKATRDEIDRFNICQLCLAKMPSER